MGEWKREWDSFINFHLNEDKEFSTENYKEYCLNPGIASFFNKKDPRYGVLRAWVMGNLFLASFLQRSNPRYIWCLSVKFCYMNLYMVLWQLESLWVVINVLFDWVMGLSLLVHKGSSIGNPTWGLTFTFFKLILWILDCFFSNPFQLEWLLQKRWIG